ncbi:leucine-rich repeat domain-containing protein [Mariniblastus fucicola]|uniref:Leucine Rich repeats (2 copies) n=1 Tax=Mariniblastus fucicola TaxID=980251 RepID=A0A5B9PF55_9BACT|nr:hypothetical protein [Mariniblastus fucicola]QEG23256.1 Leucine Rich repeats (2 copies) [Mariniblastus fucicola]
MTISRNYFVSAVFALFLVLMPHADATGQLSNIAWKAAEQLKKERGNELIYSDEGFVTELIIEDFPAGFLMGQLEVFPMLESVTIDSRYYFEDGNMGGIRKLMNLKKFGLKNSRYATSSTLEMLAEAPVLETVEIHECSEITSLHEVVRIRRLENLVVVPDEAMSFAPLVECRNLKSVKLFNSSSINDSAARDLGRIKSLESVDLTNTAITDEGLSELGSLPNLKKLILEDCEMITGETFAEFQFPEELVELNLSDALKIDDLGLSELKRFTSLEHLRMYRNHAVLGKGFECLASLQKLKTLSCPETSINDQHLQLLAGIDSLEMIWLPGCKRVSGRGIDALSKSQGCKKLSLNECRKIDSPDFEVLAKFEQLEELYIAETRIRNEGLELLCQLKKLKVLNIGGNLWLEDVAIEKLKDSSVEKLIATDLPRLTDAAFESASEMRNLVNLCVSADSTMNGSGIKAFAGNTRIKYLTFEDPSWLSLEAFASIRDLPNVEEIYFNDGKVSVSQLEQLAGMQNLRVLKYEVDDSDMSNERLISILKTFPKLE